MIENNAQENLKILGLSCHPSLLRQELPDPLESNPKVPLLLRHQAPGDLSLLHPLSGCLHQKVQQVFPIKLLRDTMTHEKDNCLAYSTEKSLVFMDLLPPGISSGPHSKWQIYNNDPPALPWKWQELLEVWGFSVIVFWTHRNTGKSDLVLCLVSPVGDDWA